MGQPIRQCIDRCLMALGQLDSPHRGRESCHWVLVVSSRHSSLSDSLALGDATPMTRHQPGVAKRVKVNARTCRAHAGNFGDAACACQAQGRAQQSRKDAALDGGDAQEGRGSARALDPLEGLDRHNPWPSSTPTRDALTVEEAVHGRQADAQRGGDRRGLHGVHPVILPGTSDGSPSSWGAGQGPGTDASGLGRKQPFDTSRRRVDELAIDDDQHNGVARHGGPKCFAQPRRENSGGCRNSD